jgi:two-component sensor histidine kinase
MAVNEFLTNSFKYAFPRGAQNLTVSIGMADGRGRLIVADDGPGMPADTRRGVGLQLIEAMARQINGEVQWDLTNGTRLTILFDL